MSKVIEIKEMQNVAIRLSYATAHCAVGVSMVNGRAVDVREKAVCLQLDTGDKVWFPAKALVNRREHDLPGQGVVVFCELAKWLKLEPAACYKVGKAMHSGMIAA